MDEPGLGKSGKGVLYVDDKEVAKNSMEHGTPITFPEDETFDIGSDTRTGVAMIEYRYESPFKFTGKINKLTFRLEPEQLPQRNAIKAHKPLRQRTPLALNQTSNSAKGLEIGAMNKVLVLAAVSEAATGVALLIVPSLVGRLLLGAELTGVAMTGGARDRYRPDRIGCRLLAGPAAGGMLTYSAAVTLYLAYLGIRGDWVGPLLWPAVALHAS